MVLCGEKNLSYDVGYEVCVVKVQGWVCPAEDVRIGVAECRCVL